MKKRVSARRVSWILAAFLAVAAACVPLCIYSGNNRMSFRRLKKPCLLMVCYHQVGNHPAPSGEIDLPPLDEIQDEDDLDSGLSRHARLPTVHGINPETESGDDGQLVMYYAVRMKNNRCRIGIAQDGVKSSLMDVHYDMEKYLTVARGGDWYLAITSALLTTDSGGSGI